MNKRGVFAGIAALSTLFAPMAHAALGDDTNPDRNKPGSAAAPTIVSVKAEAKPTDKPAEAEALPANLHMKVFDASTKTKDGEEIAAFTLSGNADVRSRITIKRFFTPGDEVFNPELTKLYNNTVVRIAKNFPHLEIYYAVIDEKAYPKQVPLLAELTGAKDLVRASDGMLEPVVFVEAPVATEGKHVQLKRLFLRHTYPDPAAYNKNVIRDLTELSGLVKETSRFVKASKEELAQAKPQPNP